MHPRTGGPRTATCKRQAGGQAGRWPGAHPLPRLCRLRRQQPIEQLDLGTQRGLRQVGGSSTAQQSYNQQTSSSRAATFWALSWAAAHMCKPARCVRAPAWPRGPRAALPRCAASRWRCAPSWPAQQCSASVRRQPAGHSLRKRGVGRGRREEAAPGKRSLRAAAAAGASCSWDPGDPPCSGTRWQSRRTPRSEPQRAPAPPALVGRSSGRAPGRQCGASC